MVALRLFQKAASSVLTIAPIRNTILSCYTAGGTGEEALELFEKMILRGYGIISDRLGEEVKSHKNARHEAALYILHLRKFAFLKNKYPKAQIAVSIKLTQLGLKLPKGAYYASVRAEKIFSEARKYGIGFEIDMEGPETIADSIKIISFLSDDSNAFRVAIAANQELAEKLFKFCIERRISVRIVKGAYPSKMKKKEINQRFSDYARRAVDYGLDTALATHDALLLSGCFLVSFGMVSIQMLLGIRTKLQKQILVEGFKLSIYGPWGGEEDAIPYILRRMQEGARIEVLFLFLRNIFEARRWRKELNTKPV